MCPITDIAHYLNHASSLPLGAKYLRNRGSFTLGKKLNDGDYDDNR